MDENSFKFSCPHCGQHIEVDCDMIGMGVDCPTCGKPFTVPEMETHRLSPVITVIKKRESFIDKGKNLVKAIGIGIVVLLPSVVVVLLPFVVGVGVIKEILDDAESETKAVGTSINCLLNFIRRPNDRRSQALFKSMESCPMDFQDAVKKYLEATRKTIGDFMTQTEEDPSKELERELYHTIRRGSPVDLDPQLAGLKSLAVGAAAEEVMRRRESRIEAARLQLKTEIENAAKRLIDVAEKYGIDAISLEDALLN